MPKWSCDEKPKDKKASTCRNPHGCHCREIEALSAAKAKEHERGFASGVAVTLTTIDGNAGDQSTIICEVMASTGLTSRAKMKAAGVDRYDLDKLRPYFKQMAER